MHMAAGHTEKAEEGSPEAVVALFRRCLTCDTWKGSWTSDMWALEAVGPRGERVSVLPVADICV